MKDGLPARPEHLLFGRTEVLKNAVVYKVESAVGSGCPNLLRNGRRKNAVRLVRSFRFLSHPNVLRHVKAEDVNPVDPALGIKSWLVDKVHEGVFQRPGALTIELDERFKPDEWRGRFVNSVQDPDESLFHHFWSRVPDGFPQQFALFSEKALVGRVRHLEDVVRALQAADEGRSILEKTTQARPRPLCQLMRELELLRGHF